MLHHEIISNDSAQEWVVFIHGAGGSSNVWYRQIRAFAPRYNLLLVDLRGHGLSAMNHKQSNDAKREYTFQSLAQDVTEILDRYRLEQCHFIGLSLGTIIIREIAEIDQRYIRSMILAGAIIKLDMRTRILSRIADRIKRYVPYMSLYKFYAYLIMPKPAHHKSRMLFISNAIKVTHDEFFNWMELNKGLDKMLNCYCSNEPAIPTLYVMGENDYVFLSQVQIQLHKSHANSWLHVLPKAGHICNIDRSEAFNAVASSFLLDIRA